MLSSGEILIPTEVFAGTKSGPYMRSAIPQFSDFLHPKFKSFCSDCGIEFIFHRKIWEFAFIVEMLDQNGLLRPGYRGLGFGVGREVLPSYFARRGCSIVATDAPVDANDQDWTSTGQHASALAELHVPAVIGSEAFNAQVSFRACDMNDILEELSAFDFCWSACALEHLGGLEHGLNFIQESMKTIKSGGWACHTTEFNLSSNDDTVDEYNLCLYRRRDIERVAERLRREGHEVMPIMINLGNHFYDVHVDVPPYSSVHLKTKVLEHTTTSVGLLIRKAAS